MGVLRRSTVLRLGYWGVLTAGLVGLLAAGAMLRKRHQLDRVILEAARDEGLHPALVAAVVWRESRYNPAAAGSRGEIGLMQVTGPAAADWARAHQLESLSMDALWHPVTNITIGSWYLARAARYWAAQGYADPIPLALAEYNAGRSNVREWVQPGDPEAEEFIDSIGFDSTRRYVRDVLRRFRRRDR